MEYFDKSINDKITARIYYTRSGRMVYFVDDDGNELAEVKLLNRLDLGDFLSIISSESVSE